MNKIKLIFSSIIISFNLVAYSSFATDETVNAEKDKTSAAHYQNIIDEYKKYLETIPHELREEIKAYRKERVRLENEKRALYKKLSNQGQEFLKKENEFKKKLPIRMKKQISDNSTSEANSATKSSEIKK